MQEFDFEHFIEIRDFLINWSWVIPYFYVVILHLERFYRIDHHLGDFGVGL